MYNTHHLRQERKSQTRTIAGWSSLVARRAHNPKVVGSNPAPATTLKNQHFVLVFFLLKIRLDMPSFPLPIESNYSIKPKQCDSAPTSHNKLRNVALGLINLVYSQTKVNFFMPPPISERHINNIHKNKNRCFQNSNNYLS